MKSLGLMGFGCLIAAMLTIWFGPTAVGVWIFAGGILLIVVAEFLPPFRSHRR